MAFVAFSWFKSEDCAFYRGKWNLEIFFKVGIRLRAAFVSGEGWDEGSVRPLRPPHTPQTSERPHCIPRWSARRYHFRPPNLSETHILLNTLSDASHLRFRWSSVMILKSVGSWWLKKASISYLKGNYDTYHIRISFSCKSNVIREKVITYQDWGMFNHTSSFI